MTQHKNSTKSSIGNLVLTTIKATWYIAVAGLLFAALWNILPLVVAWQKDTGRISSFTPESTGENIYSRIAPNAFTENFFVEHQPIIEKYERLDGEAVESAAEELNQWFRDKETSVDPLLEDLFSFSNKWSMVWDSVFDEEALARFLSQKTSEYIGDGNELKRTMDVIMENLRLELKRNHNNMMVELETALAMDMRAANIDPNTMTVVVEQYESHFDEAFVQTANLSVRSMVAAESIGLAVDLLVTPYITQAIVQLGTSMASSLGIDLGAQAAAITGGAVAAPETLGISLVVGIIIGIGIDIVVEGKAIDSAREKLLSALNQSRKSSVQAFQNKGQKGVADIHTTRRLALKQALVNAICNGEQ